MTALLKFDFQKRKPLRFVLFCFVFWSKLSKLHKKDPILYVTITFSPKRGETRTYSGPIPHHLTLKSTIYNYWHTCGTIIDHSNYIKRRLPTLVLCHSYARPVKNIRNAQILYWQTIRRQTFRDGVWVHHYSAGHRQVDMHLQWTILITSPTSSN